MQNTQMTLVLASNSPRRRQLLAFGGWDFFILAVPVDERVQPGELPADYVTRLAENKARETLRQLAQPADPQLLVVAADTAVIDQRSAESWEILGKPQDAAEAESMLRQLRGRSHQVYTAVVVLRASDSAVRRGVCITAVPMRQYSDAEIAAYIASGDPFDKAGGYAIQHSEFDPVENLAGCYANVMGLPVCHLARLLAEFQTPMLTNVPKICQKILGYDCPIFEQVLNAEQPFEIG